jgi:hypothetical protein
MIKRLYEFNESGGGTNMEPSKIVWSTPTVTILKGIELFSTGADKINKESPSYKKLLAQLKDEFVKNRGTAGTIPYLITGGASAVKASATYDNAALAKRRATNMLEALKTDLGADYFPKFDFQLKSVVGKATVKGPEADAEQFVKVSHRAPTPSQTVARDATATPIPLPRLIGKGERGEEIPIEKIIGEDGISKKLGEMCFTITTTKGGMTLASDQIVISLDKVSRKFTIKRV